MEELEQFGEPKPQLFISQLRQAQNQNSAYHIAFC